MAISMQIWQTWIEVSVSDCTCSSSGWSKDKQRRRDETFPPLNCPLEFLTLLIETEGDSLMHLFLRIKPLWTSHTIFLNLFKLSSLLSHGRHKRLGSPFSHGRVPAFTISATLRRLLFFFKKMFLQYFLSQTLPQRRHLLSDSKLNFG